MLKRLILTLSLVLVLTAAWLLSGETVPENPDYRIPLQQIRERVRAEGLADAVRVEIIAEAELPRWATTAWNGLGKEQRVFTSFKVITPSGSVIIDAPHPERLHAVVPGATAYHRTAFERMQDGLENADAVHITHIHGDHVAGIPFGDSPDRLVARLELNELQMEGLLAAGVPAEPDTRNMGFPADLLEQAAVSRALPWRVIAPGLAAIAAPGHTPGHQIFYVATDAHEFLLLGDLVWTLENLRVERGRPRLVSRFIVGEDSRRVADELATILQLAAENPELVLLPSHDKSAVERAVASGQLVVGF